MLQSQLVRYLHRSLPSWSTVSKSSLLKLRKKTGYTFSNCKKALEVNENDVTKAEKWLQEQAQALGWSKLSKLEGRSTEQGLVGIAHEGRIASMIEINCETDFVARNKTFKEMVNLASLACLQYAKKSDLPQSISKVMLENENLKSIEASDGKTLADHTALLVSSVGENVTLKRCVSVSVSNKLNLSCYVHPQVEDSNVMSGRYGAIIAYSASKYNTNTEQLAKQLCQHIVGMNPKTIHKEIEENEKIPEVKESGDSGDPEENEEEAMMSQDFLLDPTMTVKEVLAGLDMKIVDFVRFETGEPVEVKNDQPIQKQKVSVGG